ncbi:MAG: phenylalanine--tRNA ligase subunit alpha, partial [Candidatus Sungiibacteriota bacterium]
MINEIKTLRASFAEDIQKDATLDDAEKLRVQYLGRKGALAVLFDALKNLPPDERKQAGEQANTLRRDIEQQLAEKRAALEQTSNEGILKKEWLDVTRTGVQPLRGHLHPITKVRRELEDIFISMGFGIAEGPEMELEHYNFDALNMPETHPARESQDTWWIRHPMVSVPKTKKMTHLLLRTQVTQIQVRYMEKNSPPFRIIMPGTVFRRESTDASHEMQFAQMDGMMVDNKASLADLKGIMEAVLKKLFGPKIKTRLRAGFFPFVEPGVEMDIECLYCAQKGCSVCKQSGWIEVFPGGVVHPAVF